MGVFFYGINKNIKPRGYTVTQENNKPLFGFSYKDTEEKISLHR